MDFPLNSESYNILHQVAKGPFREIYVARCSVNDKLVAIKQLDLDECPIDMNQLRKGTSIWSQITHDNVVKYYGSFIVKSSMWCISHYMDSGSCRDILDFKYSQGIIDEVFISSILSPVLEFLNYLHKNHYIHRDIRCGNILLSAEGIVKVGDLCLAANFFEQGVLQHSLHTQIGSTHHMAPEVYNKHGYTLKADIWSIGITLIELATGKSPYHDFNSCMNFVNLLKNSNNTYFQEKFGHFSIKFQDFLKSCLAIEPNRRLSAQDLLKSSFLKTSKGQKYISTFLSNFPTHREMFISNGPTSLLNRTSSKPILGFLFHEDDSILSHSLNNHKKNGIIVKKFGRFTMTIRNSLKVNEK